MQLIRALKVGRWRYTGRGGPGVGETDEGMWVGNSVWAGEPL